MRVAIMQPTYLPWAGYFDLMDQVDAFVLLDTVQFDKRSWQQRNRIKGPGGLQLLSVPVNTKGRFEQRIMDVALTDATFVQQHVSSIMHAYRRAPYFETYFAAFSDRLAQAASGGTLSDLTTGMIDWLAEQFAISVRTLKASELTATGKRSGLLSTICHELGAKSYLSPAGAAGYLAEERSVFDEKGIDVFIQSYEPQSYPQLYPPFQAFASALDILFNCASESLEVIRAGRRPALKLSEWIESQSVGQP